MTSWLTKIDEWTNLNRPTALLGVVGLTLTSVVFANWVTGEDLFQQLFYPKRDTVADVRFWSALIYALGLALSLPVAFLLWHWRDRNVRDQIDNARKDINLKEFQEVQLRAAGALDEKLPNEAREQLQIAALHQIRSFLRGEYGLSFKLPAMELILSGHAAAIHRVGVPEVQRQIGHPATVCDYTILSEAASAIRAKLAPVDFERMAIIREEFDHIFCSGSKLQSRRFDLIDFSYKIFPPEIDLDRSQFFGCDFSWSEMTDICLSRSHIEAADFHMTILAESDFRWAHLQGAFFYDASLENTNLYMARLEGTLLANTNLFGAHLRHALFSDNTALPDSMFDDETSFGNDDSALNWENYTDDEKDVLRAPWVALGAVHADTTVELEDK